MTSPAPPVIIPKYLPPGPSSSTQPISSGPPTEPSRGRSRGTKRTGPTSHSPRAGTLPDGRELFIRKPNTRRNWEPVRDHFCESCGGLYPRTPFDWEEVGYEKDGTRFSALRKVSLREDDWSRLTQRRSFECVDDNHVRCARVFLFLIETLFVAL